jgi:hypothetical protein
MQTRTYGSLFKLIQSLAGVSSFTTEENGDISRFINRRYFQAYNESPIWVRYLVTGEKRPVSSFKEGSRYYSLLGKDQNENNFYLDTSNIDFGFARNKGTDDKYWEEFEQDPHFTTNPVTGIITYTGADADPAVQDYTGTNYLDDGVYDSPEKVKAWRGSGLAGTDPLSLNFDSVNLVQFTSLSLPILNSDASNLVTMQTIGEFIKIHRTEPYLSKGADEYDFIVTENGAEILNFDDNSSTTGYAYVTYKKPFTAFTTSSDYDTSTEEVPEEFFAFIAHSAYADFLRMDGQHQKALIEEQTAKGALDLQLERNDIISNNNNANIRFSTYVSRQSR